MTDLSFLREFVIILAAAVAAVVLLRRFRVPSIAGFIAAGALVGPNALGLVADIHHVETIAELGVVLLLFGIGLELSLERIRGLWRAIAVGGAIQVGATILVVVGICALLGVNIRSAVLIGCIVAISSTAIVLRGLSARGELESPHGRLALGILVFQDLCVVPMVLIIPLLANTQESATNPLVALLTAVGVLAGVLVAARLAVPRLFDVVAATRQRDLFVLSVFLVGLGTAWAVSRAGISLALGAFLAGLVVASGKYRQQVFSDLVPLREVLASIFFVSIGMLLDVRTVLQHAIPILGLLLAIVLGKFAIMFLTAMFMRLPLRTCILTGVALCQVGEFSFVLLRAADGSGLLDPSFSGNLTVAVILSMLFTPFAFSLGPRLAGGIGNVKLVNRLFRGRTAENLPADKSARHHVIIAGYGLTGQSVAQMLKGRYIPFIVVDLNIDNIDSAKREAESAFFGDVTSVEILEHLGAPHARMLVISINDHDATVRAISACRSVAPELQIIARARFAVDVGPLEKAGATNVIDAETAAAGGVVNCVVENLSSDRASA
jgi:CPA2 family monovalent cation:H+ antiporter-2